MAKNDDYNIDIKELANNPKAIQELLSNLSSLHESFEEAKSDADKARTTFHEAIEILDDGFVMYDEEDRLVVYNTAFRDQIGEPGKYLKLGETYKSMTLLLAKSGVIPGIEGKEEEFVANLIEQRNSEEGLEKTFQTNKGEWIRQRDKKNASGNLVGLRTNITELKKREEELAKATKNFSETTNSMVQGIVVFKEDNLQFFNSRLLELLQITENDIKIGDTFEKFLYALLAKGHYDNNDEIIQNNINMMNSGEVHHVERETHYGTYLKIDVVPNGDGNVILTYTDITNLKNREAELELARSESETALSRQSKIANAIAQGVIMFENEKVIFYNKQALETLELSDDILFEEQTFENFLNMQANDGHFGTEQEGIDFVNKHTNIVSIGIPYQIERVTKSGKTIRVDGVPNKIENSLTLTFTDISTIIDRENEINTAKTELESALCENEQSKERFKAFAETNTDWFWEMNSNLEFCYFSESFETVTGVAPKNLLGTTRKGSPPPDVDITVFQAHLDDLDAHRPFRNFVHSREKDGKKVWLSISANPVFDRNGNFEGYLGSGRDITDIKNHELELAAAHYENEETSILLDEAIDAMPQGLLIHDQDNIQRASLDLAKILDIPESLISPGSSLREFARYLLERGDQGDIDVEEALKESDKMCTRSEAFSFERVIPDGRIIITNVMPRKNGGMVSIYTDITEDRKRELELDKSRKEAESAERAKSEFLANMSHEIRTPMNGVMGMAELLASTELDAKQKMFTDVIVKSGASLLTIINDILDFSKIDAGQMELDPAPFNLAEAIEDVATLVSSKVAEKDLELIVRVDPALPKMMVGDVGRIRQIVTNLLGNAVKFTEKGHVFVNIENKTGKITSDIANLKFSIEDTGIGIPEEKSSQVFQKFSQVDTSATRKHEGTGLGLSISSSLVELMGGEIGVESEVGKGSTFWFTADLPIHSQDEGKTVVPGDMTGARILVIDDNKVNRSILAEQMAAWNFDGASTSTGPEGLDVMRAVIANGMALDLVILDYQMPDMSGAEVLEIMRNDETLKDIPVVMLTSVDSSQANQRLQKLGAEANLTKPTRSSMLLETILQVIANKRADVKTRSINNLTAKPIANQDNISLLATSHNENVLAGNQELDILVAEDNEVNQIVFRQILEVTGLNFKIVENGRLAFASYKVQKPRLILMDVSMPEMNGKEATTAIRKYERENKIARTPIVGVTAHALKGDMEACIDAGMDDYLSKPVSPNKLSLKIEQWLKVNLGTSISG